MSPAKRALLALEEMQSRLEASERAREEPVAVVGLGCRFPSARNPEEFWRLLAEGKDAVTEVPADRWDAEAYYSEGSPRPGRMSTRWGGFVSDVGGFDASFFGITPREASALDPQQRLVLEVAWEALEEAGVAADRLAGSDTGVFIGIYNQDYSLLQLGDLTGVDAYTGTGTARCIAANRLSYLLDLRGPSLTVDTSCSSSLVAVHLACQSLRQRECGLALAGGVNLILSPVSSIITSRLVTMAADGRCKTFDASADGIVRGEGCGVVVLKRLSDAVASGDQVLAVIRGSAVNQDGLSNGLTAPNLLAQQAVIEQALRGARIGPAEVTYVEAHGTGTTLGDPIELEALKAVYGARREDGRACAVGSVKTNLGHLEAAAGIAGLIKAVLSLKRRAIPPHLHFRRLNPNVTLDGTRLEIPTRLREWDAGAGPRCAGVSSFSIGGTNAHLIVAESPETEPRRTEAAEGACLLPVSARDPEALRSLASAYKELLSDVERADSFRDVCYTAAVRRSHHAHRLAVVGQTAAELASRLEAFLREGPRPGASAGGKVAGRRPGLVFVFNGQGAQWVGMGSELLGQSTAFRRVVEECDAHFKRLAGWSLLEELNNADESRSRLQQTEVAQAAIFAVQAGLAAQWGAWGVLPDAVVGHSVGEVAAAHTAGVLNLEEAARVVFERGRLMRQATGRGRMVAVEMRPEEAEALAESFGGRLSVAAVNGPRSVVLSGEPAAVEEVFASLQASDVACRLLQVNCAFHSRQMEPLRGPLRDALGGLEPRPGAIPVASTVTGRCGDGRDFDAAHWARNLTDPVRFMDAVGALTEAGLRVFLEVGPHPALSRDITRCLSERGVQGTVLASLRRGAGGRVALLGTLGALYTQGFPVEWGRVYEGGGNCVALPTYPWQRKRYWVDAPREGARAASVLSASAPSPAASGPPAHPLLGRRLRAGVPIYEAVLGGDLAPYLSEHRVEGEAVLPAAAYLEMAAAAGRDALGVEACALEEVSFHRALALPEGGPRAVQMVLSNVHPGAATFQLFAEGQGGEQPSAEWTLHAEGSVRAAGAEAGRGAGLSELRARFRREVPVEEFYQGLAARGFDCGPSFRGVSRLWRGEGEALALVRLPRELHAEAADYRVHPALLDACLQIAGAALPAGEADGQLYLAAHVGSFLAHAQTPAEVWSHAEIEPRGETGGRDFTATVTLYDGEGRLLARAGAVRFVRAGREPAARESDEWLYEVRWVPKELPHVAEEAPATCRLPAPTQIARRVRADAARHASGLEVYGEVRPRLDALCAGYVLKALGELGWRPGEGGSAPALAARLGVAPRHRRLFERMLEILEEDGLAGRAGSNGNGKPAREVLAAAGGLESLAADYPACAAELRLLGRCGPRLAAALRGECDPLELLFGGPQTEAEDLYHNSPLALTLNALAGEAVALAAEALPPADRLRVLEVGAGTGGTTAALLPRLPAGRTEYVFSDLSNLFLFRAREKFRDYPFVRYRLWDAELDAGSQGEAAHSFDLVVAANVLHATADLRRTLGHVRRLLKPGGMLLLLEGVGNRRWADLTFGLTEGWWKFTDQELRPAHPLLPRRDWTRVLAEAGFEETVQLPETAGGRDETQGFVALARAPRAGRAGAHAPTVRALAGRPSGWLILADRGGVGERLAEELRARGHRCTVARAAIEGASARFDGPDPTSAEDLRRLLAEAAGAPGPPLGGVVHLWSLDASNASDGGAEGLTADVRLSCGSALHLVQAVLKAGLREPPRLWFVTRGAQGAGAQEGDAGRGPASLAQSPLWGLGRVLATEHPEMWGGLIDVDEDDADAVAALLRAEVESGAGEDNTALRGGRRYAARLAHCRPAAPEAARLRLRDDGSYLITGGLGGMGLAVASWMAGRGARRLVLVGRQGARGRDAVEAVEELRRRGVEVDVRACDVADAEQLARVVRETEAGGRALRGVVHAAGVAEDGVLANQEWGRFEQVLAPKVRGAWNLHAATLRLPLDFFVLFSSATTFLGLAGLASYTAANAFLGALARGRRASGLPALCIEWGGWERVGMAKAVGSLRESQWSSMGLKTMEAGRGLEILERLLLAGVAEAGAVRVEWGRFLERFAEGFVPPLFEDLAPAPERCEPAAPRVADARLEFLSRLEAAYPNERHDLLADFIRERVVEILMLDGPSTLDDREPLNACGLDSLMSVELRNTLAQTFGRKLPATLLFDYPTVESLAGYLSLEVLGADAPAATVGG